MAKALSAAELGRLRELLMARREEIRQLDEEAASWRDTVELDQQSVGRLSRMDAMQQQQMAEAEARRRSHDLTRISAALERLAEGEYGWCTECGEAIAVKRLEIDPAAAQCIGCASSNS